VRGRGRPAGSTATNMAIREGKQHTLAALWRAPVSTPAVAEQRSVAKEIPKTRSEPVPEIQTTIHPADDTAPSTLSGFRKASGCCPLCNELVGARMHKPSACKRRVLDNAPSSLGLKLRDLCRFPCLGWCGKKPMPCCASKPPPQNTCDECYWVCTVHRLLRETLKDLQEARHLCSDGQHLGLRRRDRGGGAATSIATRRPRGLWPPQEAQRCAPFNRRLHRLCKKAVPSR